MKRKTQLRAGRWTDQPRHTEAVSPYSDAGPPVRDVRATDLISGPGPYESSYDIMLGYAHDRSIVLP
jgi:hypothetical protein